MSKTEPKKESNDNKESDSIPTTSKAKKSVSKTEPKTENNDNEVPDSVPTKGKAKKTISKTEPKTENNDNEVSDSVSTKGKSKKTVSKTESKEENTSELVPEPVKSKRKKAVSKSETKIEMLDDNVSVSSKEKNKKVTSKKEVIKDEPVNVPDDESDDDQDDELVDDPNVEPDVEPIDKKPTKGGKKTNNTNLKIQEKKTNSTDEENYKIWKQEWSTIVCKINEHLKISHELEKERDELVKKMDLYLSAKNGSIGENILELNSKLKKTITKFDVAVKPEDSDDDSDTTDDDSDDSNDSDDSDDDSTPLQLIKSKKVAIPKFAPSSSSKKIVDSDSDDSS